MSGPRRQDSSIAPPGGKFAARRTPTGTKRPRLDRIDLVVFAAFAGVSLWVLGLDLWQVIAHGRSWTGTDGVLPQDQMQYLAWIRAASRHVLASNLFVLRATPADYFQPVIALSGAITALGVAPWLALLIWKPVAVVLAFFAIRAYARRCLAGRWQRRVALVLALFFGFFGVSPDLWFGFWTWGYPFELIAIAAMLGALLSYDRAHAANRLGWSAALLGALTSALHPWQGETLIVIVVVVELATPGGGGRGRRLPARPALTVIATSLPLAYYAILDRADSSWRLAQDASRGSASLWRVALALAPLAVAAALAYRRRPRSFIAAATRAWPFAALGVFLLSETQFGGTPMHAFAAITVPLAVLAVEGAGALRALGSSPGGERPGDRRSVGSSPGGERPGDRRSVGSSPGGERPRRSAWVRGHGGLVVALVVAALTIPVTVYELRSAAKMVSPTAGDANFIRGDERAALAYLARDREPGGVLTRFYLGTIVPAETGRRTFVGNCYWSTPDCSGRAESTAELLAGSLTRRAARALVRSSGARFVLADCRTRANLVALLGPIVHSVHRFGCAGVYEVLQRHGVE